VYVDLVSNIAAITMSHLYKSCSTVSCSKTHTINTCTILILSVLSLTSMRSWVISRFNIARTQGAALTGSRLFSSREQYTSRAVEFFIIYPNGANSIPKETRW
jgi:hypothetical protein